MVNHYQEKSINFRKIKKVFHQGLVYPLPYRIVRVILAALFIYAGFIKLIQVTCYEWKAFRLEDKNILAVRIFLKGGRYGNY